MESTMVRITKPTAFVFLALYPLAACGPDGKFNDRQEPLLSTTEASAQVGTRDGSSRTTDGEASSNIDAGANKTGDNPTDNPPDDVEADAIRKTYDAINETDVAKRCADLANTKTLEQVFLFPEPKRNCSWGENGNMAFDNGIHQLVITARLEQELKLEIPPTAIICDMGFDFPVQEMRYDDEIFLAFNNIVLLASQDYRQDGILVPDAKGLVRYDWAKLKGKRYPINERPNYFVDSTCKDFCKIPPTETKGQVKFRVDRPTVQRIAVESGLKFLESQTSTPAHTFKFVTTGDNDASLDCLHSDFTFKAQIRYLPPQ
jgi:hypothetical protein